MAGVDTVDLTDIIALIIVPIIVLTIDLITTHTLGLIRASDSAMGTRTRRTRTRTLPMGIHIPTRIPMVPAGASASASERTRYLVDAVAPGVAGWSPGHRAGVGWFGGNDGTCDAPADMLVASDLIPLA
jgi:hypothetical protein